MKGHQPGLRAGAYQREDQDDGGHLCRWPVRTDLGKNITAIQARQHAIGEQKRECSKARHDEIDVAGTRVVAHAVVAHDERPGGKGHEFPGNQESEGIVGKHDKIHAGKERWIERQYPVWRGFVSTVAKAIDTGRAGAKIDDQEKKSREFIQTKMSSDPRQSKRQSDNRSSDWTAHNAARENQ